MEVSRRGEHVLDRVHYRKLENYSEFSQLIFYNYFHYITTIPILLYKYFGQCNLVAFLMFNPVFVFHFFFRLHFVSM